MKGKERSQRWRDCDMIGKVGGRTADADADAGVDAGADGVRIAGYGMWMPCGCGCPAVMQAQEACSGQTACRQRADSVQRAECSRRQQ